MLVFFDESGDAGLRFDRGSSEFFVVAAVLFREPAASASCGIAIENLKSSMNLPSIYEFHFWKSSHRVRCRFFETVARHDFAYYAFVLNKRAVWGEGFSHKESLYKYPVRLLFENMAHELRDAKIIMDRCGDRAFRSELVKYLKRHTGEKDGVRRIRSIVSERSHNNALIQLADMICGAVARSFRRIPRAHEYRNLIRLRERQVRFWPADK